MIAYAGVSLGVATVEVAAWVEQNLSVADVVEFAPRTTPGLGLLAVPWCAPRPPGPVRPGRLYWPWGAQRYAVGHYLTTSDDLATIRDVVYPGDGYEPADLVLDDETTSVTAEMWMLPPRPLGQVGEDTGLWLLTLVDERFFWWQQAAAIEAQVSWTALYGAIGTALGAVITVDTIVGAFLTPPESLASTYHALPVLLDAVAASVGQRIVRGYDGSVTAQNAASARTSWETERDTYAASVLAGGSLNL